MKWQPTPEFLPEKPHGQRSLVGYSPVGHKESDTTERLSTQKRKLLLDVSLPVLSPSPTRILLPSVTHSSRTRWSPVQKRRKVLALERRELGPWAHPLHTSPPQGCSEALLWRGRGRGLWRCRAAQALCAQHFRLRRGSPPCCVEVRGAALQRSLCGRAVLVWQLYAGNS